VLLVPISISGLGVREGLYVAVFGPLGVDAPLALALSLATYSLDFSTGLAGGVIYFAAGLLGLRRPNPPGPPFPVHSAPGISDLKGRGEKNG
jgi:hypothetical protein